MKRLIFQIPLIILTSCTQVSNQSKAELISKVLDYPHHLFSEESLNSFNSRLHSPSKSKYLGPSQPEAIWVSGDGVWPARIFKSTSENSLNVEVLENGKITDSFWIEKITGKITRLD